ncbi:hypothetical protein [Spiroplasma diminutum]|uniref:Uncharacterized protein n=1 Tax=Spiroplasma diminutum CUAS-1 TaxID=1276221 RepID=S5MK91_9MOLU|nr:hypothetical protein [Spiroplasma diminutum]AGR42395.1 hypothetical protein SDIMI_v3c06910 [Spiroplasma diminutum CUAS-1]
MLKILKLLFIISGTAPTVTNIIDTEIINIFKQDFNIQEHELKKEPMYFLTNKYSNGIKEEVEYQKNSSITTTTFDNFLTLKELELEHIEDFWFDSDLDLHFTNIIQRDSNEGNKNSYFYETITKETFNLNIKLDKRQEYKKIQHESSYHDKWNDVFVYSKLNLEVRKIYGENKGLQISGIVQEEVYFDSKVLNFKGYNQKYAKKISGGLFLKNIKTNFISRKDFFEDTNEEYYVMKTNLPTDYRASLYNLEKTLKYDENFYRYLGITKNSYHDVNINALFNDSYFQNNKIFATVDLFEKSKVIKKNIKIIIIGAEINNKDDLINIDYKSNLKNLDEEHNRIKYYLSNKYLIPEKKIKFNLDDIDNSNAIKKFENSIKSEFKYEYIKPSGAKLIFKVHVSHAYKKGEENIIVSKWNEIKFSKTDKNYEFNNQIVLDQSKIQGEELEFKNFETSIEKTTIRRTEIQNIFILNGSKFRNIKIKNSDNLKVKFENKNIIKIEALSEGNAYIKLDSIDAKESKIIEFNVIKALGDFSLDKEEIEMSKGETEIIDIETDYIEGIELINKNKNVNAKIIDKELSITINKLGYYELELFSKLTLESKIVKINVVDNNALLELNKHFIVSEINSQNNLIISNYEKIDSDFLNITANSDEILFTRTDSEIVFIAKSYGDFNLKIKYKDQIEIVNIKIVKEISEKNVFTNKKELTFDRSSTDILFMNENLELTKTKQDFILKLLDLNSIGYIEVLNTDGEKSKITIKADQKDINNENGKDKTKEDKNKNITKILAISLIPITLGTSILFFFVLKKLNKKQN